MAKKKEPEITEEQRIRIEMRKRLLFTVCETKEELQQFIKTFLKLDLPDCTVDELSTSNPMEAVWQIYLTMKTNKGAHRVVVAASRNSMKTVMSAVIHWLAMVHFRRSCLQIAAIKDQSYKAIKYLKKFLRIPELQEHFETNRAGELRLSNLPANSHTAKDDADVFVTAATLEGANSSRASIIIRDECDLTPREILSEVAMVADPTQDEHSFEPITISLSSRKTSQGPLQELMEEAEKGEDLDIRLDKWSAVDFMKACPPETHGEKRLKAYLHTENLKVRWDEETFQEEPQAIKTKYKEILAYEGCVTCPAFIACQARAPKQTGKSKTLRTIAFTGNFIKETKEANKIIAQILNWRPETGGLVFPTFSRHLHVRNIEETWFWLTNQQWKVNRRCTKQDIYAWAVTNKWEVSFGVDWGVRDPAVVVVFLYSQAQTRAILLHTRSATGYPNSQWAETVRQKECMTFPPDIICPDMADAGSAHYFQPHGFAVKAKKPTHIETGVSQIQSLLWNVERQEADMILCKAENDSGIEYSIESFTNWMHKKDPRGEFDTSRFEDDDNTHTCFTAGHKVITSRGAINIEDVQPNDYVLTHKGRFKQVKAVMSSEYSGELLEIQPYGRESIFCTPEHPFFALSFERSNKRENGVKLTGQLRKVGEPSFKPAKSLQKTIKNAKNKETVLFGVDESPEVFTSFDMTKLLPEWIQQENGSISSKYKKSSCEPIVEFDKHMAFIHGHFAAEGSCGQSKDGSRNTLLIAIHQKERKVSEVYFNVGQKFNLKKIFIYNKNQGLGERICINSKPLYTIFKPFRAHLDKKYPDYVHNLSVENTWYVILGHAFGDGHFSDVGLKIPTISKHLAYQLIYMMQKIGLKPKIRVRECIGRWTSIGKDSTFKNNQYVVQLDINDTLLLANKTREDELIKEVYKAKLIKVDKRAEMSSNKIKTEGLYSAMLIKKTSTHQYTGRVYTLSVEDDESYTINGVAVQNCDATRYALDKYRTSIEIRIASKKNIEQAPMTREQVYRKDIDAAMYDTYKEMGVPMMPSQLAEMTIDAYKKAGMGHLIEGADSGPTPEPKKKLIKFSF